VSQLEGSLPPLGGGVQISLELTSEALRHVPPLKYCDFWDRFLFFLLVHLCYYIFLYYVRNINTFFDVFFFLHYVHYYAQAFTGREII